MSTFNVRRDFTVGVKVLRRDDGMLTLAAVDPSGEMDRMQLTPAQWVRLREMVDTLDEPAPPGVISVTVSND